MDRIDFGCLDPDSRGQKSVLQKRKKVKKFHVLKCWMFSWVPGRLEFIISIRGLGIRKELS
jgi:hypothetical protein